MLQKILLFASPILSAASIATVIAVKSWKKKKLPNIHIEFEDDEGREPPTMEELQEEVKREYFL